MTGTSFSKCDQATRHYDVVQFLYRDARLLDEWRLEEWYDQMLTGDVRYLVPATDVSDDNPQALALVDDNAFRLRQRVEQILSGEVWCENPRSRTNRSLGNISIDSEQDDELRVSANAIIHRFGHLRSDVYVVKYQFVLMLDGESFRIRSRVARLDHETLFDQGKLSIIL